MKSSLAYRWLECMPIFEMKLTKEEKQLILAKRKSEQDDKPKKFAFARSNIYILRKRIENSYSIFDEDEKNSAIANAFELVIPVGTKFVCFIDDNEESWYDDIGYGIEAMNHEWARKYLKNIRRIKK